MNEYGGYFELELADFGGENYPAAYGFNSGRNALRALILARKIKKLCLPYYICGDVIDAIKREGVECRFIDINYDFSVNMTAVKKDEYFLCVNYFGVCDQFVKRLSEHSSRLIVDNSQAFFSFQEGIDTIYSPRKFFGVPDGGYLLTDAVVENYPPSQSFSNCNHLLARADVDANCGYSLFLNNEKRIADEPIMAMSTLTKKLLSQIDFKSSMEKRKKNFQYLHSRLNKYNSMDLNSTENSAPMAYPLLNDSSDLRELLIENKIYVAQYWKEVANFAPVNSISYAISRSLVALPSDHRYSLTDMKFVADIVEEIIS